MRELLIDNMPISREYALEIVRQCGGRHSDFLYQHEDYIKILNKVLLPLEATVAQLIGSEDEGELKIMRECAADASRITRVMPFPEDYRRALSQFLNMASLAVIGGEYHDASDMLKQTERPPIPIDSEDWCTRCWATVVDAWCILICGECWNGREVVLRRISDLRKDQKKYEEEYLESVDDASKKGAALELIAFYNLAKAADRMAGIIFDLGFVDIFDTRTLVKMNFDQAIAACERARMLDLGPMTILLKACALRMIDEICVEHNITQINDKGENIWH